MRNMVVLVVLALVSIHCAPAPVEDAVEASESTDVAARFLGSWSLGSFTRTTEEGETLHPMGEDAFGRIGYSPNGRMAVVLMAKDRESREDEGFFSYTGTYAVDPDAETVTHTIEACIAPDWIGTDRVRRYEFLDADTIALRPVEGNSELIWRRER